MTIIIIIMIIMIIIIVIAMFIILCRFTPTRSEHDEVWGR